MRYARVLLCLVFALVLIVGCSKSSQSPAGPAANVLSASDAREGLRLTLELPKERFVAGKTYYATLSLTNLGARDLTFDIGRLFGLTVVDANDEVVWPDGTIPPLYESQLETLEKGEAYSQPLVFTVKEPGVYKVRARLATGVAHATRSGRVKVSKPPALATNPIDIEVVATSESVPTDPGDDNISK